MEKEIVHKLQGVDGTSNVLFLKLSKYVINGKCIAFFQTTKSLCGGKHIFVKFEIWLRSGLFTWDDFSYPLEKSLK